MKRYTRSVKIISAFICLLAASCAGDINNFNPSKTFSAEARDTVLTDLITFIYVLPSGADKQTRFDAGFRTHYVSLLPRFNWLWHFKDETDAHYFYIMRPARNIHRHKRGVAGKFRLDENGRVKDFEELLNTPTLPEEEVTKKGELLFREIIKTGGFKKYHLNKEYIEFPDERTFYDKELTEWVYKK